MQPAEELVLLERPVEFLAPPREPILPQLEPEFVPHPVADEPAAQEAEPELSPLPLAHGRLARLGNRPLASAPPRDATDALTQDPPPALTPASEPVPAGDDAHATAPEPLPGHARPPIYPARAERMGWEGLVVLRIAVDAQGRATSVRVDTSSGHGLLDRAALEAVHTWRFRPGTRAGRPVPMELLQRISFEL